MWVTTEETFCEDQAQDASTTDLDSTASGTTVVGTAGNVVDTTSADDVTSPGEGSGGGVGSEEPPRGWSGSVRVVTAANMAGTAAGALGYSNGQPPSPNVIYVDPMSMWSWLSVHPELSNASAGVIHQAQPSAVGEAYYDGYIFDPARPEHLVMLKELQDLGIIVFENWQVNLQIGSSVDQVVGTEGYMPDPVDGAQLPL